MELQEINSMRLNSAHYLPTGPLEVKDARVRCCNTFDSITEWETLMLCLYGMISVFHEQKEFIIANVMP